MQGVEREWSEAGGGSGSTATTPRRRRRLMVTGGDPARCSSLALVVAEVVGLDWFKLLDSLFAKIYHSLNLSFCKGATSQTQHF